MAWVFGDGFDLYTVGGSVEAVTGYWDSGTGTTPGTAAGRFSGSQCLRYNTSTWTLTKSSGQNDALHHFVLAFKQEAAISGTTLATYLQLLDGTTGQCAVVFRSDGAILLTSGSAGGTTLATYTGAFPVTNTWYGFEIEINISNTAGYMNVRKNGNTTNDFSSATNLNTRVSANNYANKLTLGCQTSAIMSDLDDLFWRSDASAVAWMGDLRCYTRMPASDASVQYSRSTGSTNASCVDEAQENALTDYVFDSTVGHADLYNIAATASTPATVIAVTTRAYMQKSDAGTRTANVALKSGGTTVNSPTVTLSSSGWLWAWRTDTTDPATAAAWTAAAVDAVSIGPVTVS